MATSPTSTTKNHLIFTEERMKKADKSLSIRVIKESTRNGMSSMLTKLLMFKPRDFKLTSDSTSTGHSTSDQDSQ